ncbi:MAG: OmpA family protein [Pseudomonadota bacterium]
MIRYLTFVAFFATTAIGIYLAGQRGAAVYETLMVERVRQGFAVLEVDWITLKSDGLRLELHGRAPNVEGQALAARTARAIAAHAHVVDFTSATISPPPVLEPVLIELHRDADGLTATGRMAGEEMRQAFSSRIEATSPGLFRYDLTGTNAAKPPPGWGAEVDLAVLAVTSLSEAYLKLAPGQVLIEGVAPDEEARAVLQDQLIALAGPEISLALDLRVPPQVIIPFRFAAQKDFGGLRVEACAARDLDEQSALLAAMTRHRVADHAGACPVGLGGPEGAWAEAVSAGLAALDLLPAGRLEVTYQAAELEAEPPTEPERFDSAVSLLQGLLPEGFTLETRLYGSANGPAAPRDSFWLSFREREGKLHLAGRMATTPERDALLTYGRALFGKTALQANLGLIDGPPPPDWQKAAQSVLDAMEALDDTRAELTAGRLRISGTMKDPVAAGSLRRELIAALPDFEVRTRIAVDLPSAIGSLPLNTQTCVAEMNRVITASDLAFETGSAVIEAASLDVLDELAAIFARCKGVRLEIGGHTDSQGNEEYNLQLSQSRAEAVLDALLSRAVALDRLSAKGYGEAEPLASNQTPEGRAANRRIEFKALE